MLRLLKKIVRKRHPSGPCRFSERGLLGLASEVEIGMQPKFIGLNFVHKQEGHTLRQIL